MPVAERAARQPAPQHMGDGQAQVGNESAKWRSGRDGKQSIEDSRSGLVGGCRVRSPITKT
jgi:hypothetical protein